jgi:hypothetical protein
MWETSPTDPPLERNGNPLPLRGGEPRLFFGLHCLLPPLTMAPQLLDHAAGTGGSGMSDKLRVMVVDDDLAMCGFLRTRCSTRSKKSALTKAS